MLNPILCCFVLAITLTLLGCVSTSPSPAAENNDQATLLLYTSFASASPEPWTPTDGQIQFEKHAGRSICILAAPEDGSNLVLRPDPASLGGKRLTVSFDYILDEYQPGSEWDSGPNLTATWKAASPPLKDLEGYHRESLPTDNHGSNTWNHIQTTIDFSATVSDPMIRIGLQHCTGRLRLRDIRLVTTPQKFTPVQAPRLTRGKLLFEDEFNGDTSSWVFEGTGTAATKNGWLQVRLADDITEKRGQNLWLKQKLPADVIIEMRVRPLLPTPEKPWPSNLLYFLSAQRIGGNLLGTTAERDGIYRKYIANDSTVNSYTITWYRINDPYFLIARRNPGWNDLGRNFSPIPAVNVPHDLVIEKKAGRILFIEDGIPSLLVSDPSDQPLADGYFALRAWRADADYDYVRIYEAK